MSLKSTIAPRVAGMITSTRTRDLRRRAVELRRYLGGGRHRVHYFHQVDDPYSHLAAQLLEPFLERYDVELDVHLVGPPADAAAPDRERLVEYSRVDASRVAAERGLVFRDPGAQPADALVMLATRLLATAPSPRAFAALAPKVGEALWDHDDESVLAAGEQLRTSLGHYLGAVFCYGGESYWGVDRLGYLENRLVGLGAARDANALLLAPRIDVTGDTIGAGGAAMTLEYFVSLRSPYSYISMPRTYALAARTGVELKLRPVLPMVMRGLAVPAAKRWYITLDSKREADSIGVPFGRIADPVGRPVERAFSLYPYAASKGRAAEYLHSFCRAAFAEGVATGTDEGLRHVIEGAGLPWADAMRHADQDGWRAELETNREEMLAMGLWGVPSYRLRGPAGHADFCTWGQDRIHQVESEIRLRAAQNPA